MESLKEALQGSRGYALILFLCVVIAIFYEPDRPRSGQSYSPSQAHQHTPATQREYNP